MIKAWLLRQKFSWASKLSQHCRSWSPHTVFRLNLKLPTNMGINLVCQALRICAALISILKSKQFFIEEMQKWLTKYHWECLLIQGKIHQNVFNSRFWSSQRNANGNLRVLWKKKELIQWGTTCNYWGRRNNYAKLVEKKNKGKNELYLSLPPRIQKARFGSCMLLVSHRISNLWNEEKMHRQSRSTITYRTVNAKQITKHHWWY